MNTALRVSLISTLRRSVPAELCSVPLLDPAGPYVCIGNEKSDDGLAMPVRPSAHSLFGPRGAALIDDALWICDTGHHRLLGWARSPENDDVPADWVIGQPDFSREGRNAKRDPGPATLNVPTGLCACGRGLAVADAWNHRVLIWNELPQASHAPADLVLGQADFGAMDANRGGEPTEDSLFWPYGLLWDGESLWVADTGNRRVLRWRGLPTRSGQPADLVLGQNDFRSRNENGGGEPDAASLRWPHALARWGERLCVADAGNNRILVWDRVPDRHNAPSDHVLGQASFALVDHNQSRYWPDADALNMPYGLCARGDWLMVADTANSRLLGWHREDCCTGASARALSGQPDFGAKGDNRWAAPVRDSLCWPYGIAAATGGAIGATGDDRVVIADSGNSRVLLWRLACEGVA